MAVAHVTRSAGDGADAGAADGAGLGLYYEMHGLDGGAPVLNIGGSGGDLRRTFPDRLPLNKHCRVLSYDQRWLGRSDRPDGEYTMAHYADDAAALIEHVGWEHCHVMGTSFGGMVALNLAVRHPHLIDRMVLSCTSPGGTHASYPLENLRGMDADEAFVTRMQINDTRWNPDADEPTPGMGGYYTTMVEQARAKPDPEVLVGLVKQIGARAGHDVEGDLASIGHESLVCAGRYDGTAPLVNSEFLAAEMPDARLAVFEGGHLFFLQDRSAYPAIIEFLQHGHQAAPASDPSTSTQETH
jgi:3-oxoadipate enol-lactonase